MTALPIEWLHEPATSPSNAGVTANKADLLVVEAAFGQDCGRRPPLGDRIVGTIDGVHKLEGADRLVPDVRVSGHCAFRGSEIAPDGPVVLHSQCERPLVFPHLRDGEVALQQLANGFRQATMLTVEALQSVPLLLRGRRYEPSHDRILSAELSQLLVKCH